MEEAEDYMRNHTTFGESNIKYEIMRYVARPGQVGLLLINSGLAPVGNFFPYASVPLPKRIAKKTPPF